MNPVDEETVSFILTPPQGNTNTYIYFMLNFLNRKISYYSSILAIESYSTNNISVLMPKNLPVEFTPTLFMISSGTYGNSNQMSIYQKQGLTYKLIFLLFLWF